MNQLSQTYDSFWFFNKDKKPWFINDARVYRTLITSLLDNFCRKNPEFFYDLTHSEYGRWKKISLELWIELGVESDSEEISSSSSILQQFKQYLEPIADVIPWEFREHYDLYIGAGDDIIKITNDAIEMLTREALEREVARSIGAIGYPKPMDQFFQFQDLVSEYVEQILSPSK